MYKILIADDEPKIREIIKKYATFEGHEVIETSDGMEVINCAKQNQFDIIILDIMMPELDGFSACKEIRKFSNIPIVMLSARGDEYDKINGFEIGADDYVVKPFSPRELMLRIDSIIKRSKNSSTDPDVLTYKTLKINFTSRTVEINGERIDLSPKEYSLLFYLSKNRGIALSRDKLLNEVWGYDFFGDTRTLDTHIKLLRKNLKEYSELIVTLRGVGYRFEA